MEYQHRRTEARYQKPSLLCSNGPVLANPSWSFYKANWSLEKHFAIMLAQLKTVVLVKEAIKLAFFRLVEYFLMIN